jgi:hypothetical protein
MTLVSRSYLYLFIVDMNLLSYYKQSDIVYTLIYLKMHHIRILQVLNLNDIYILYSANLSQKCDQHN